jgi:cytochrome c oxidase assembly protein subunit 15
LAYGKIWPDTDPASVLLYNQRRIDPLNEKDIEAFHIQLQMLHRCVAVVLVSLVGWISWRLVRLGGLMARLGAVWSVLLVAQFFLGAATIWTNKAVDIATAHVAVGAISLMMAILITVTARVHSHLRISEVNPCSKAGDFLKPDPASVATRGGAH